MQQVEFVKKPLFDIDYAIVDYNLAAESIIQMAARRQSFGVSALAVHGLVTAAKDCRVGNAVRSIDMVVPDGQPVRWALNLLHRAGMQDRVYGPTLTLHVLNKANEMGLSIFLFGSTKQTLDLLTKFIHNNYSNVRLAGIHVDRFRDATLEEDREDILKINQSGAHIVLVGRGCPRQEIWVADHLGRVNAAMMAVGAAFDFHAGTLSQAPHWMQKCGLEWFFRLLMEPRRLWKRYLTTNSYFIWLCFRELFNGFFGRKSQIL
jgi:N-acetylglucosaminyldiphosphoundecaprenol N-acetyl-beta-D-mannosaminyltransferase